MGINLAGKKIEKVIYSISRGIRYLSITVLFFMMLFVTAGVIGRYILNKPIKGDIELQELMMVVIVFGALAYATTAKQHVFVELLVVRLKGRALAIVNSLALFLGLVILAFIIWRTGIYGWNQLMSSTGKITLMLEIPVAPFILLADAGLILMALVFMCQLVQEANKLLRFQSSKNIIENGVEVK